MATREISVQRFSLTSSKPFRGLVAAIDAQIGHPDMKAFQKAINAAKNAADLEKVVQGAVGPTGFMEFARFDLGEIFRKERGTKARPLLRMVIGNPLIMKEMVKLTPDAGSYAPITVLIDEREDGVHLSYDRMASFLAPYGSQESVNVAQDLDAKVESLLKTQPVDRLRQWPALTAPFLGGMRLRLCGYPLITLGPQERSARLLQGVR